MFDIAARIEPVDRENRECGDNQGSETHGGGIVRYSSRHAARVHQDARRSATTSSCSKRRATARLPTAAALARALRPPQRHRLRPGDGARSRRAAPARDIYYRIFNADGGEVEQCGNGVRCIAALLHSPRAARQWRATSCSTVPAGLDPRARSGDQTSCRWTWACRISIRSRCRSTPRAKRTSTRSRSRAPKWRSAPSRWAIRTPCSRSPRSTARPVDRLGPAIERHPRFPKRVNVGFMEIVDRSHIRLRVYERGAGETLACGTGRLRRCRRRETPWAARFRRRSASFRGGKLERNLAAHRANIFG